MDVRQATADDVPAIVDLAALVDPPDEGVDVDAGYYAHVIATGRFVVAEESGIVVGYAGSLDVDGVHHLTDLFVHPDLHGVGLGGSLLREAWSELPPDAARQTFSSLHRAALPLYLRSGLTAYWPLVYLRGDATVLPPGRLTIRTCTPGDAARHEQSWLGWNRLREYEYWAARPRTTLLAVYDGDDAVAVGAVANARGWHSTLHLACADRSLAAESTLAALAGQGRDTVICLPGPHGAIPALLDEGWKILGHDLYCATDPDLFDETRLATHAGLV